MGIWLRPEAINNTCINYGAYTADGLGHSAAPNPNGTQRRRKIPFLGHCDGFAAAVAEKKSVLGGSASIQTALETLTT